MANPTTAADDDRALKKRLLTRMAIAGAIIVALLGGLALVDTLHVEQPSKTAGRASSQPSSGAAPVDAPTATSEKSDVPAVASQSDAGIIRNEEPAQSEEEKAAKSASLPAEETTAPPLPPPREPSERRPTRSAEARLAAIRPTESAAASRTEREMAALAPASRSPGSQVAAPSGTPPGAETMSASSASGVSSAGVRHAPASRPLSRLAESANQYLLQLGVFSNLANAEELRARLELAGVPAHLEARVQVGPFATREEALRAQEKIRALGLEPGLVVAVRK